MDEPTGLSDLEREVGRRPTDGSAWGRLGQAFAAAEQHELALVAFRFAARFSPAVAVHWLGLVFAFSGA